MIKCVIEIKEVPGKGYRIQMIPDQSNATSTEMRVAGCIDQALRPVFGYLMRKADRGEMLESKDVEILKQITAAKTREFDSAP